MFDPNELPEQCEKYMSRFLGCPVRFIERTIVFGAYDNIIARFGAFGKFLRAALQFMEKTPLRALGLSHFWVVEKG